MKIAKYKRCDDTGDWESISEVSSWMEDATQWVRISEIVEIDFKPLPPEQTIQKQVNGLNNQREKIINQHLAALAEIDEKISKLRAITYEPEVA